MTTTARTEEKEAKERKKKTVEYEGDENATS